MTSVLFMAGAGGSLRAGATVNPVALTRSVNQTLTRVTCGGAPVYVWPGGGITFMVDVTLVPPGAFGYVPTPALVAPLEFTMRRGRLRRARRPHGRDRPDRRGARAARRALLMSGPVAARTADGSRLHLQHGPIDLIIEAWGEPAEVADAYRRAWERFQPLLDELVAELPTLRRPLDDALGGPSGPVGATDGGGRAAVRATGSSRRWRPSPAPSPTRSAR